MQKKEQDLKIVFPKPKKVEEKVASVAEVTDQSKKPRPGSFASLISQ